MILVSAAIREQAPLRFATLKPFDRRDLVRSDGYPSPRE